VYGIYECTVANQGSARLMMDKVGDEGLVVDGRKLFFEYRYAFM